MPKPATGVASTGNPRGRDCFRKRINRPKHRSRAEHVRGKRLLPPACPCETPDLGAAGNIPDNPPIRRLRGDLQQHPKFVRCRHQVPLMNWMA